MLAAGCLVTGCIGTSILLPAPSTWGVPSGRTLGACPDVRGTFRSEGIEFGLKDICVRGVSAAGSWNCSHRLDEQFRMERHVPQVTITQSDADTIVFSGTDAEGRISTRKFSRSQGDFVCDTRGLTFTSSGSFFSDANRQEAPGEAAMATLGGLMILRGGMRSLEKTIYVSDTGNLIMNISVTNAGVIFPFPFRASFSAWLQWTAATTAIDSEVLH